MEPGRGTAVRLCGDGGRGTSDRRVLLGTAEQKAEGESVTRQALEGGVAHVTTRRTSRRGARVDVELSWFRWPSLSTAGGPGYLLVYHDVTAVKEVETRFRGLAEELLLVTYIDAPWRDSPGKARRRPPYLAVQRLHEPPVRGDARVTCPPTGKATAPVEQVIHPDDRERVSPTARFYETAFNMSTG